MPIYTSKKSVIGQKLQQSSSEEEIEPKSTLWCDEIVDIVIDNSRNISEDDVTLAVDASVFAMRIHTNGTEDRNGEKDNAVTEEENGSYYDLRFKKIRSVRSNHQEEHGGMMASFKETYFTFRRYFGFHDHNEEEEEEEEEEESSLSDNNTDKNGLFGHENIMNGWILSQFLRNEANNEKRKKVVAVIAWFLACIGLVLALGFLTRDFINSSTENASTVEYKNTNEMTLPKLWLCAGDTQQPLFFNIPDGYFGQPLFWIDYVKGSKDSLDITYPNTRELLQLKYTQIGAKAPPLSIDKNSSSISPDDSHVAFRISHQSFLSNCRSSQVGIRIDNLRFFRRVVKEHSESLQEKGILKFGGLDPKDGANDGLLFPLYRMGGWNSSIDLFIYDVVDMYCNVYMFSGYFYPSTRGDIRYEFDSYQYRWRRSGEGPYFPQNYSDFYSPPGQVLEEQQSFDRRIGYEPLQNNCINVADGIHVMTNASRIGDMETLAVLRPKEFVSLSFSRNDINGKQIYQTQVMRTALEKGDSRTINFVYFVDMKFSDFFTRCVTNQQAMSWTAFLADFFGLTSLFLDISVYTILVSPVTGRKAPKKQKLRRRSNVKANNVLRMGYSR